MIHGPIAPLKKITVEKNINVQNFAQARETKQRKPTPTVTVTEEDLVLASEHTKNANKAFVEKLKNEGKSISSLGTVLQASGCDRIVATLKKESLREKVRHMKDLGLTVFYQNSWYLEGVGIQTLYRSFF